LHLLFESQILKPKVLSYGIFNGSVSRGRKAAGEFINKII